MRDRYGRDDDDDRGRREWSRLSEDDMREARRSSPPRPMRGGRGDFERQYGSGSGSEGYGGRDYAHTGAFTGSEADFSEPSGRHRGSRDDFGSGDRGFVSRERTRLGRGTADDYGRRHLETGGRNDGPAYSRGRSQSPFDDEPASFGRNMQGNFGFDRGGEGAIGGGYFGGSDRGRHTTSSYAANHGHTGGDLDRGFAGNSAQGGTDRGYSGGLNYGFGGGAYRSFRGVGPRSFRRSDERLREMVSERLEDDHDVDASEIEVTVENGVVRLSGSVPDRQMKRIAEDVAESVRGVTDVENHLRIGNAG